jgi:D-3-phosphoglycerate dehydrogenase/C-terminal binding protein
MRRPKVVVTDFIGGALQEELEILGDLADVEALAAQSEEDLLGRIEDADAMMVYHCISITSRTIDRLQHCKLIVRCGVGFDNVDGQAARRRGIPLANVPDYGTEEVADSAIGMTLSLMRGINFFNRRLQAQRGDWSYVPLRPLHRLRGQVFGIVGLGRIGTAAAQRAKALGFEVVFYDPYVPDGRDKSLGVRRMETLEELLRAAHVVSMHCPLTHETRHTVNAQTVKLMRRGSFVVNTARGGVVDATCIADAIASGQLGGAAIDVLETEPPADDHPLIRAWRDPEHAAHERVILNPHAAFYCEEGLNEMRVKGSQNCRRALLGERIRNVVN